MEGQWAPELRAQGTFKDPNVLSTFLILPACFLVQGFLLGTHKRTWLSAFALIIVCAGIFFAYSRGAWVNAAAALALLVLLTFVTTPSFALRTRIVTLTAVGIVCGAAMIAIALSFEHIRSLFEERANLLNYYDSGETGRFGNQLNSLPLLLQMPNGMGPAQFRHYFTNDPHNVFLNAFASYGWIGGISFLVLVGGTVLAGWRALIRKTPWRHDAVAVFCPLFTTLLQGVQIDTDHWRHLYLMFGMMWGYYSASGNAD
jgi:O-antigen ligase